MTFGDRRTPLRRTGGPRRRAPMPRGSSALLPSGRGLNRSPITRRRSPSDEATAEVRDDVRARAGGRCQAQTPGACTGEGSHAHHLTLRSQGGTHTLDNLAWVCHACHAHLHDQPAWAMAVGLLRSSHGTAPWAWTPDSDRPACTPGDETR